jgi:hypothetical protein
LGKLFWSASWSPDGKTLAVGGDDCAVHLWDPAIGKEIRIFSGHKEGVLSVAWSPDGKILSSAGRDRQIRLWDFASGREIRRCRGHEHDILSVSWSTDGKTLASASDRTIRLWDAATGKEIRSFGAKQCRFANIAFSPDGLRLASANSDTTVLVWTVPSVPLEDRKLSNDDLSRHWKDLASEDGSRADLAVWTLVAAPEQSVAMLKQKLAPPPRDPKWAEKLAALIADLDSEEFAVRDKASAELGKLGVSAEAAMRKALQGNPSPEAQRRIKALLDPLHREEWPDMPLQNWRALAVLERIGSDEARQVLSDLAKADPAYPESQEAAAALERLQRRKSAQGKP